MGVQYVSPLLPSISEEFHLSAVQTGWLTAAYSFPALFLTLPCGMLGDFLGKKRVLICGLILYGISGLLTMFVESFPLLVGMRALQGIGYTAVVPLTVTLIAETVPREQQIMAQGYRVVSMSLGEFLLPVSASLLVTLLGHWRGTFWLFAVPLVVAYWAWHTLPKDPPTRQSQVSLSSWHYIRDIFCHIADGILISLMLAGFVRWFIKYAFYTYVPLYLAHQLHVEETRIGLVVALPGVVGALAASQAGRISSERAGRSGVILSTVVLGLALAAVPWVLGGEWVLVAAILLGIADGLSGTFVNGLVGMLPAASVRASVVAASGFSRNLGKAISPVVVGFLVAWLGIRLGLTIVGLCAVFAPAYLFPLWSHRVFRRTGGIR